MFPKAKITIITNFILFISSSAAHVPAQLAVLLPSSATHAAQQDEWPVQLQFPEGASVNPSPPPARHAAPSSATEVQGSLYQELRSQAKLINSQHVVLKKAIYSEDGISHRDKLFFERHPAENY